MTEAPHCERRGYAATVLRLHLPLERVAWAWAIASALLVAYALTMARDLSAFDSPELALAANGLGLGHPPGQPIHVLLGYAFAHLPGIAPLFGLNLLSALAGALCVLPAWSLVETLLGRARGESAWLGIAFLPLGLHPFLWESATRVEVYSLAAFFCLWAVARVAQAPRARDLAYAGVALGLGACANPYVAMITALALAPGLLAALARRRLPLRAIPLAITGGVVGLLPYLYVPWVAAREYARGVMVWGAPDDPERLKRYFLGLDYGRSRGISGAEWLQHVVDWFGWAWDRGVLALLLAGLAGVVVAPRRSLLLTAAASLSTALGVALIASNTVWQPDIPDYLGYLVLAGWIASAGVITLLEHLRSYVRAPLVTAFGLSIALVCLSVEPSIWQRTRHLDRTSRILAESALREVPKDAFVIAESDHWVAPMLYVQWAEELRPDVVVLAYGLASSTWFWQQTLSFHPRLRPAPLTAAGGRSARVRRFLDANPERPVMVENLRLAHELGLRACVTGWLRRTGADSCPPPSAAVDHLIQREAARLGEGAPPSLAVLSAVALERGLDLWQQGELAAADRAFLAAVPPARLPPVEPLPQPSGAVRRPPAIGWQHEVALGEPARNLFLSSLLRAQLRDLNGASALAVAAAEAGLPEAQRLIAINR